ncbi:MAG TPA: hypothetical protein VLB05_10090, partial [Dongiaceae bacterium]|nr:hypothetical protein [Dongiaceae bacterium]
PTLASWSDVLRQSGIPAEAGTDATAASQDVRLAGRFSGPIVIAAIALLCVTVAACFALACFAMLKLRAQG